MSLLNRVQRRKALTVLNSIPRDIEQTYNRPARLLINDVWVRSGCIGCIDQPCLKLSETEICCEEFPDFAYERNNSVCPLDAISWDYDSETPIIDNDRCIRCGLCAARCRVGAIYRSNGRMKASTLTEETPYWASLPLNDDTIRQQEMQLALIDNIAWKHQYVNESDDIMKQLYSSLSRIDGRSMVPNLLVRNLLICLGYKCAIRRAGDVYTRMDAVYAGRPDWNESMGVIEIEFGRDTLDASRNILDDIAVLHSRSHIDKEDNSALVVCLSFPNKRQGYFQVIKDISRVLGLTIQTLSVGALLMLVWNSAVIDLEQKEFYTDFDNLSIRSAIEYRMGRTVSLSNGILGILEPEK